MSIRKPVFCAAALLALGLSACDRDAEPVPPPANPVSPVAEAAPVTARYVCDSGLTVGAAYPDPESAQVTWRDQVRVLRSAPIPSGARYIDEGVEWTLSTRDNVETGVLTRVASAGGEVLETCRRTLLVVVTAPPVTDATQGKTTPQAAPGGVLPASAPCKGGQLALSADGGDAGAGNRVAIIGVRNTGTEACSLTGYPAVTVQDRQNRNLTAIRSETSPGSYLRAGQAPAPVNLAPNAKAFFDIAWNVVPNEGQGQTTCPSVTRVRATVPGDGTVLTLAQAFTPCGGRVRISPFRSEAEPAPQD
ncbi:DUF4232 domain-containing protein [Brevundimonas sp.]